MSKPSQEQGDNGESFVFGSGKKFNKGSAQFEALGQLDKLNSFAGFARHISRKESAGDVVWKARLR